MAGYSYKSPFIICNVVNMLTHANRHLKLALRLFGVAERAIFVRFIAEEESTRIVSL